jgi:tetratricopeptide (TPR) repeat protein
MRFYLSRLVAVLLLITCFQTIADNLDNLPAQWQQRLKAVAKIDPSLLKPGVAKDIANARAKVDALLRLAKPDEKNLASAYGKLANLYLTHGLYTSADICYDNAIQLEPEHFPWRYYSGYLNHENGNMTAALSSFKLATELDSAYLPAKYRLAQVHLDLNQLDEAYVLYNTLLNNAEFEAAAHYGLGQVYLVKQDYDQAAKHLAQALELDPDATSIHYPLALALRAAGKSALAKQHLQQYKKREIVIVDPLIEALETLKDPAYRHFVEAMSAVIRKNFDKASNEFEAGLAYNPENTAARTSYARVLYLTGDREKSRMQLERIIRQDQDKAIALFLLAVLDDESNNKEQAVELYRRVIDLDTTHEGANFFLGNYYLHRSDHKNAIRHYEIVVLNNDKNVPAHIFKLAAMMRSGASDKELIAAVQKITSRAPDLLSIKRIQILLLALSLDVDVRDSKRALTLAEEMYKKHQHPVNLELLALANASAGDFKLATERMREALTAEQQQKNSLSIKRMQNNLLLLKAARLPELDWHEETKHMLPPPTKALATFRDYPDANPI